MRVLLATIALASLFPLLANAQDLQFGVGIRTSVLSYNQDQIDQSRVFWGGHGRIRFIKYLAGEVSLQRREDDFRIHQGEIKLETTPLQISALVFPLAMLPVSPYFVMGTGWYFLTATVSGDLGLPYVSGEGTIHHTETAFHIGVGVEAFVGNHVSVGGDVRKVFLDFNTPIIRYKFNAYLVNLGVTYYF